MLKQHEKAENNQVQSRPQLQRSPSRNRGLQFPFTPQGRGSQVLLLVSVFVLMLMLAAILLFSFALINSSQPSKSSSDDSRRVQANASSYLTISPSISSPTPPSSLFAFSISSTAPLKSDKWVRPIISAVSDFVTQASAGVTPIPTAEAGVGVIQPSPNTTNSSSSSDGIDTTAVALSSAASPTVTVEIGEGGLVIVNDGLSSQRVTLKRLAKSKEPEKEDRE